MVQLQDRKLDGHQHLDAQRVARRVLESNVVADHTVTPMNAQRDKLFSVSNFERPRLVMPHLRWSLSFLGRA